MTLDGGRPLCILVVQETWGTFLGRCGANYKCEYLGLPFAGHVLPLLGRRLKTGNV